MTLFKSWGSWRRFIGVATLVVGVWDLYTFVLGLIGGREIIGVDYLLLVQSLTSSWSLGVTIWFLLSTASKIGMILNIRRIPLSVVATVWYFVFAGALTFLAPQQASPSDAAALTGSIVSLGPLNIPSLVLLTYLWPSTDGFDALLTWLTSTSPGLFMRSEE